MKNKKTEENIQEEDLESLNFIEKFKKSKKFRAKLELIGYGVFILIIIVFLNFSSSNTSSYNYSKTLPNNNEESNSLSYKDIENNYSAAITTTITKDDKTVTNDYEITKDKETYIVKRLDNSNEYKISDTKEFYTTDNTQIEEKEVFNLISYKYLDIENIKKYIDKGTVDYTTKYSSGVELTSYKTMIRDIHLDNNTEDYITINITNEEEKITIEIDYTSLLKNDNIDTCNVKIAYTNIDNNKEEDNPN